MSAPHCILVFDSGMGGLTVARAVREAAPEAALVYAADTAAFPYGAWAEAALVERICEVMGALLGRVAPDVAVIACNTASTLALGALRARCTTPFVGTVPAIKPAAAASKSGIIGVLATPGTVAREYTQALIQTYADHCTVVLHGAKHLAAIAEAKLRGTPPDLAEVGTEIAPAFRQCGEKRTDTVVLGCTHYPLLVEELQSAAPWPVEFIDPAPAIARRVRDVLKDGRPVRLPMRARQPDMVFFTARRGGDRAALAAYARFGFKIAELLDLPVRETV